MTEREYKLWVRIQRAKHETKIDGRTIKNKIDGRCHTRQVKKAFQDESAISWAERQYNQRRIKCEKLKSIRKKNSKR